MDERMTREFLRVSLLVNLLFSVAFCFVRG